MVEMKKMIIHKMNLKNTVYRTDLLWSSDLTITDVHQHQIETPTKFKEVALKIFQPIMRLTFYSSIPKINPRGMFLPVGMILQELLWPTSLLHKFIEDLKKGEQHNTITPRYPGSQHDNQSNKYKDQILCSLQAIQVISKIHSIWYSH